MYGAQLEKFDEDYAILRQLVTAGKMSPQVVKNWIKDHGQKVMQEQRVMRDTFSKTRAARDIVRDVKEMKALQRESEKDDE